MPHRGSSRPDTARRYARHPDTSLVAACLGGEAEAWDALIERYQALIYSTLLRQGLAPSDADDVFQDVCLVLYSHLADLRDTSRLSGWLASTAKREAWRLFRRRGAAPTSQMPEREWEIENAAPIGGQEAPAPDALVIALEEQQLVRRAVEQLPDRCRTLLALLYMTDPPASYAEVSEKLGMPIGGIGPNRARCLQRLQKLLAEAGF